MNIALGVTEVCVDKRNKLKMLQGKVMKFDRENTIDIPLVPNRELSKNSFEGR